MDDLLWRLSTGAGIQGSNALTPSATPGPYALRVLSQTAFLSDDDDLAQNSCYPRALRVALNDRMRERPGSQ